MGLEREELELLTMADAVPEAFSVEASPCEAIPPDGYDSEAVIRTRCRLASWRDGGSANRGTGFAIWDVLAQGGHILINQGQTFHH
jgi:hypothetical protein